MMSEIHCSWAYRPADLVLNDDEVHVWCASLNQSASSMERLAHSLSLEECKKAERFYFAKDRLRFIVRRGLLRTILSYYLDIQPDQIRFRYGSHGKPELAEMSLRTTLRFNLSHSRGLALYAVTHLRSVGIDVEYVRPITDAEEMVQRYFSPQEKAAFLGLPASLRLWGFFNCWTRKEAYLKALGDGLARPLDSFAVSLAPGETARLLNIEGKPHDASRWSLQELAPASGYVAALAAEGQDWSLACWQWTERTGGQDLLSLV
jgi:4'-phosphopantetheinyl transferase